MLVTLFGNRDAGHCTAIERIVADAGDQQAINRIGDGYRTATSVSADIERAIVIGRVSELGLHHDGQRQKEQQWQQSRSGGGS